MNRFHDYISRRPEPERAFYQGILDSWDPPTRERADHLATVLQQSGCEDPEGWVFSEISEGIPQSARFALLRAVWERAIAPAVSGSFWLDHGTCSDSLRKLEAILSPEERATLFMEIAKALAFQVFNTIDEGMYNDELPGWTVTEVDRSGARTGRELIGLHESILDDALSRSDTRDA
jgi:hypothetical protein